MNELNIIRDAIVKALQASDYRCPSIKAARSMVKNNVHLGRLDPGQWCPEALVIALTEDVLGR